MRGSGEALVGSLWIRTPLRALDLGCGDGTTALPLARLGADVVGIDIARNLVEAGRKRAAEAGLRDLRFQEGDACDLQGVEDHSFDLVLSVFGAMSRTPTISSHATRRRPSTSTCSNAFTVRR